MNVVLLLLPLVLTLRLMAQSATADVESQGLPSHGVKTETVGQPIFESIARNLAPALRGMLPHSVVVRNDTDKAIVLFAIRWSYDLGDNGQGGSRMQRVFEGKGNYIRSGSNRMVNYLWVGDGSPLEPPQALLSSVSSFLQAHQGVRRIKISLDMVLFEDGAFVGPDEGKTVEMLVFRRGLYAGIVTGHAAGASPETVFASAQSATQLGGTARNMMRRRWAEEILELKQRQGIAAAEFAKTKLLELPQIKGKQ